MLIVETRLHPLEEGRDVADLILHRCQPLLLARQILGSK
jgi:hypothetical protein